MLESIDRWYTWLLNRIAITQEDEAGTARRAFIAGGAAVGGVLFFSLLIGVITSFVHNGNLSVIYLVPIIILAIVFGRGAAILAALLAFLAYDFFFVPPVHLFSVEEPVAWLSLSALLLTGVVVGQLTAEVRRRERSAIASEHQTALLYTLAQDIAAETDRERLLPMLASRLVTVFAPEGLTAGMIWLPGEDGHLELCATAHAAVARGSGVLRHALETALPVPLHQLDTPEHLAQAEAAFREKQITTVIDPTGQEAHMAAFVPLISSGQAVGILGILGVAHLDELYAQVHLPAANLATPAAPRASQSHLFAAFCEQYALALERATLQQEAIHVAALRESDRMKNALLGSVTHDLRTPIAAVQAAASSLMQAEVVWSTADRDELLQTIMASTNRLARLVDNLLALSRLEAGIMPPSEAPYPINDVVATVLDQLDMAGTTSDRAIAVDIAADPLEAPMDHAQIERVLTNLVENAVKYSPPSSPITIRAWCTADDMQVSVTDHGVGIPPDQHEKIFDRFYRLQQPLPWARVLPPQGTGLGLAICAGIIHEHGGKIWVESTEGQGSSFILTLPLAVPMTSLPLPTLAGGYA